jgi:hypothetical protein
MASRLQISGLPTKPQLKVERRHLYAHRPASSEAVYRKARAKAVGDRLNGFSFKLSPRDWTKVSDSALHFVRKFVSLLNSAY